MLGEDCYEAVRLEPELTLGGAQDRSRTGGSTTSIPDRLWVLDEDGDVFGFVSFSLFPEKSYGHIDNNSLRAERVGQGWATFMYRHVLERFREEGLRFAHVIRTRIGPSAPALRSSSCVPADCVRSASERGEERVPLGVHLAPPCSANCGAQDTAVRSAVPPHRPHRARGAASSSPRCR